MSKKIKIIVLLVFLVLLIVPLIIYRIIETQFLPQLEVKYSSLDPVIETRFLKDLEHLSLSKPFKKTTYKKNAHDYISQYISWADETAEPVLTQNEINLVQLFKNASPYKKTDEKIWLKEIINDPLFKKIDTSWMNQLKAFDHWNFFKEPNLIQSIQEAKKGNFIEKVSFFASHPIPHSNHFFQFAQIHFLKQKDFDLKVAYQNYQNSLHLLHSQGSLLGSALAAEGLKQAALFKSLYPIEDYKHYNLKTHFAYKRVSWAWPAVIDKLWTGDLKPEIKTYMKPEFSVCTGVGENPIGFLAFSDLTKKSYWPLEHNFEDIIERIFIQRKSLHEICGMIYRSELLTRDDSTSDLKATHQAAMAIGLDSKLGLLVTKLAVLPYFRRLFLVILASMPNPHTTQLYEDDRYLKESDAL